MSGISFPLTLKKTIPKRMKDRIKKGFLVPTNAEITFTFQERNHYYLSAYMEQQPIQFLLKWTMCLEKIKRRNCLITSDLPFRILNHWLQICCIFEGCSRIIIKGKMNKWSGNPCMTKWGIQAAIILLLASVNLLAFCKASKQPLMFSFRILSPPWKNQESLPLDTKRISLVKIAISHARFQQNIRIL